jgi:hypothetical protein
MTDPRQTARESELVLYIETDRFLQKSSCTSYTQLALMNPELWSRLRATPSMRLRIAISQGWPITRDSGTQGQEGIYDLLNIALNNGCDDAYLLWREMPGLCETLRRAGWLERLLHSAGIEVPEITDQYQVHDGLIELFPSVAALLEMRPDEGWPTRGGRVFRLAELILARYLELHAYAFEVATSESGQCHFVLPPRWLIVFASDLTSHAQSAASCDRVILDDRLLGLPGNLAAYAYHISASLSAAGIIRESIDSAYAELLLPEPRSLG